MKALDYENFTIATEQMIMLHFKEAEKMTENGNLIVSAMNYHMATGVFNLWFQCIFLSEHSSPLAVIDNERLKKIMKDFAVLAFPVLTEIGVEL
ncbi:hypothetical protein [Xenorhabdus bovienii]|uniref:hypothetical protein n=1 Tax=Xenorhabdus bovienii TaxID=40576 RepID=UPI003DA6A469